MSVSLSAQGGAGEVIPADARLSPHCVQAPLKVPDVCVGIGNPRWIPVYPFYRGGN